MFEVDDSVHACAALHEFPEKVGEIAGIAVDEHFLHLGVGPKLVDYLCERARSAAACPRCSFSRPRQPTGS